MRNVLILGANGSLARVATDLFLKQTDVHLTLYLRNARRLKNPDPEGQNYSSILDPCRDSAKVIEASDLDYTILRPAWFTSADEIDYETTRKGEPFKGGKVSRKSVAALIVKLALSPELEVRRSLGISKPE